MRPAPFRYCPHCGGALVPRPINDHVRATCIAPGCGFVHWDNPVPVLAAVVEHEGDIVLASNHGWPEGMFGLVAGFLEPGESPAGGILREVREELGIAATIVDFIGVYDFVQMNQVILAWHVAGSGAITPGAELRAVKRVPVARLRPWDFGTGPAVRDWLARRRGGIP